MQPSVLSLLLVLSVPAWSMSAAGLILIAIGLFAAKDDIGRRSGIERIACLAPLCFAAPLAVFGAEHLSSAQALAAGVPPYMPWRMFWVYFVGLALILAALSIATGRQVRWSGLLFGAMMFLFVALLHLPGALKAGGRIPWTIVFRELSFGGGGWVLAGSDRKSWGGSSVLVTAGRLLIAGTAIFFGVQHFLHPFGLPGVPLEKQMPASVPLRAAIGYVTGAFLIAGGVCFLAARKTHIAAAYLGAWILLLVAVIYGPVLIGALMNPNAGVQIEGLNYFADTLLFGGTILSLTRLERTSTR